MSRKEELYRLIENVGDDNRIFAENLVEEILFLEEHLATLKQLPMIKHHPRNPEIVKPTSASKMYKEFLQQYNNTVKNLYSMTGKKDKNDDSPLRAFMKEFGK